MQPLRFTIPETEHLPPEERERVLRRCLASEEMRRYKRIAPLVLAIANTVIAGGFYGLAVLRWHWPFLSATITFFVILVGLIVATLAAKLAGEFWILRRLVRKEIQQ